MTYEPFSCCGLARVHHPNCRNSPHYGKDAVMLSLALVGAELAALQRQDELEEFKTTLRGLFKLLDVGDANPIPPSTHTKLLELVITEIEKVFAQ
jgi:hypothetical protein